MSPLRQAVILAGGKGTRLQERLQGRPKPLVDVLGIPLLERQLRALRDAGIQEVLLLVNHRAEQIDAFVREKDGWGLDVLLIDDGQPRGTAGAVLQILDRLDEQFLVVYGDTLFAIDFDRFQAFHAAVPEAAATLFLHPNDHPADSDIVVLGERERIEGFSGYPHSSSEWLPNMVNAALYIVKREALRPWLSDTSLVGAADGTLDFAKHLFPALLERGTLLRGYISPEYIKDIGTPKRLDAACAALACGLVGRSSLQQPQRAVFLDRDGCLNVLRGHVRAPEELEVYDFAAPALQQLHAHEYRSILVTNQPVLARGDCTTKQLDQIHAKLETVLGKSGAFLDRIECCPHHPEAGYVGEVPSLKRRCGCRKPEAGMLFKAALRFNIDLGASWMVGDSTVDILAARRAGVSSVLVGTGEGGRDGRCVAIPEFEAPDFEQAVHFITRSYPAICALPQIQDLLPRLQPGSDWLFCGQARSGKTTLVQVLARELRAQGMDCKVLSLDRWIRATSDRLPGFEGRHDLAGIRACFEMSQRRLTDGLVQLSLPVYLRHQRKALPDAEVQTLDARLIVLWEGVAAHALMDHHVFSGHRVSVLADPNLRRSRVLADLHARGDDRQAAAATWTQRSADEHELVAAAAAFCEYRLSLDSALGPIEEAVA